MTDAIFIGKQLHGVFIWNIFPESLQQQLNEDMAIFCASRCLELSYDGFMAEIAGHKYDMRYAGEHIDFS